MVEKCTVERTSRKGEWLSECMHRSLGDGFPDGGMIVEGAMFIRNEEQPSVIQLQPVAEPVEIKKPTSRRISSWLSYFYPLSPPKKSSVSPAASVGSDVETDPIAHRFSPQNRTKPTKGILKKREVNLIQDFEMEINLLASHCSMSYEQEISATQSCSDISVEGRRRIVFSESNSILETFGKHEYNRSAIDYIARSLTPTIATLIKKELNEVKADMEVHEQSRHHTQFYQVK